MIDVQIYEIIWKEQFADKIVRKHRVTREEVEQVMFSNPHIERVEKGRIKGEDLYVAYGQTHSGRYLVVFFIRKQRNIALPITARAMTSAERRYYHAQKKAR